MNFNCTAEANPPVHTYVLYENNTINNTERSGIWTKTMKTGGEFVFRCEANNSVQGIGKSSDTTLTVNGKFQYLQYCIVLLWSLTCIPRNIIIQ